MSIVLLPVVHMSGRADDDYDPWAPFDHAGDVDMAFHDLDIMDV